MAASFATGLRQNGEKKVLASVKSTTRTAANETLVTKSPSQRRDTRSDRRTNLGKSAPVLHELKRAPSGSEPSTFA